MEIEEKEERRNSGERKEESEKEKRHLKKTTGADEALVPLSAPRGARVKARIDVCEFNTWRN